MDEGIVPVSFLVGLLLLQGAPSVLQERTPELDAANDCLIARTNEWLEEFNWQPEPDERWRWATKIVEKCEEELKASALSIADPGNPVIQIHRSGAHININNLQLRQAEALYYVDGIIRDRVKLASEQAQ